MSRQLQSVISLVLATCFATLVKAAGDEDVFELRPEIHHIFRETEKMPSAVFSTLFAFITLTPWLFLITGWLQIGYTPGKVMLDLFSGSTVRTVSIIAFLASLVSVEYLFYLYWTKLNLFQTLTFLSGLIILVFFTGQRALNSIQARRLGQTK